MALLASNAEAAQAAETMLRDRYEFVAPEEAELIVALGGDGYMLHTLHSLLNRGKVCPVFGMNRGTVGFLMNEWRIDGLLERIARAKAFTVAPLEMTATGMNGEITKIHAINEVSLLRETRQAAKLRIKVDDVVRLEELNSDGVLIATPAGSTAYNLSVNGPILPLKAGLLALTPISVFRPRRWRGAILPRTAQVTFDVIEPTRRPVSAVADATEVLDVAQVTVTEDTSHTLTLLFDPEHHLEERILKEQFQP